MIGRKSYVYSALLLILLFFVNLCAMLDRIVISLLVEPIKADLGLSDTEISLLLGLAFALVNSVAIIPMGMLVDRTNRTRLLGLATAAWSVMTALCGAASTFWTLFFARAGVGIGEATLHPAAYSLISDAFEKRRLGLALGIFQMGAAVGTGLALIAGGYVVGAISLYNDFQLPLIGLVHPWQMTFFVLAIPGAIIAIALSAMPDPRPKIRQTAHHQQKVIKAVTCFYRRNSSLLACHHIANGLSSLTLVGATSWVAPLFFRVHGWEPAKLGVWAGLAMIVGTPIALAAGGAMGDFLSRRAAHLRLCICAVATACGALFGILYPLLSDPEYAVVLFGAMVMFATVPIVVGNAALQHITPDNIRGSVSAIYFLALGVIGMAGPTLIAASADMFFPFQTGIRYATAIVVPLALVAATAFWLATIPRYRQFSEKMDA